MLIRVCVPFPLGPRGARAGGAKDRVIGCEVFFRGGIWGFGVLVGDAYWSEMCIGIGIDKYPTTMIN